MRMNLIKKIGKNNYHFQFEGSTLFEVLMESQKLSFDDVEQCGICGKNDLFLEAHYGTKNGKPAYEYCSVKCKDCKSSVTFGKTQEDSTVVFLRKKGGNLDWQAYKGE